MSWADTAIRILRSGKDATIKPHGNSMRPKVKSGATVVLTPIESSNVEIGDIVLCRVNGKVYLHLVKAKERDRLLIGNNHGKINGWTKAVYGKAIKIDNK
jgi:SOS-response transcriptional repressor LexA